MPVISQHKEYVKSLSKWELVRDCTEGACAIKGRSKGDGNNSLRGLAGTAYLPAPNESDTSSDNKSRYRAYLERASFINFTGHTKEGLLGMVFRKESEFDLFSSVEYMLDNINGAGLTADQMIKATAAEVLCIGRAGLLVDYPDAAVGLTAAQVRAQGLRANILAYPAESIINWRTEVMGGVKKLSMIVLREPVEATKDGFEYKEVMYHRVLLMKDGVYIQNLYDDDDNLVVWETEGTDEAGEPLMSGDIIPRNSTGGTWSEIPFIFVGSEDNDADVDKSPLYDIAEVNVSHYRNSADYEESSFMVGQPTPVISGLTQSWITENMNGGIALGSRTGILLPEGGSAMLLQANDNQMPLKGMEIKESQMIMLGARIISDGGGVETAEAARIRFAGQNSKLAGIIGNVESAFIKCFMWAAEYMGAGESTLTINREFYDASIDPQMIMAMIQLSDRGVIATTDLRSALRKGGLISRPDDEIDAEAEAVDILDA